MTTGLEVIKLGWLTQTDWAAMAFKLGNFLLVLLVIWALIHFLIIRPRKFKFLIQVLDITGSGLIRYNDRGGWVIDRLSRTGEFQLMKDKKARLKMPPREAAIMSTRGKMTFNLLKFGDGPHDYCVLDYTHVLKNKLPDVIPLADTDWAKAGVVRAVFKKNLGSFWAENKATIITLTAIVISMIIVGGAVKLVAEQAQVIMSSTGEFMDQFEVIADKLDQVAIHLGGTPSPTAPPPPPNALP
jgi:hypothetical protein